MLEPAGLQTAGKPSRRYPGTCLRAVHLRAISFHNYGKAKDFRQRIKWLDAMGRPLLCTEFVARPAGSTFKAILPVAKKNNVGVFCWGLVQGKTQTHLPWDSWANPYAEDPSRAWFHDIFDKAGVPHNATEVEFIRKLTGSIRGGLRWVCARVRIH